MLSTFYTPAEARLSGQAAGAVAVAGFDTVSQPTRLGRNYFKRLPTCRAMAVLIPERIIRRALRQHTPSRTIADALNLLVAGSEEAREAGAGRS